MAFLKVLTCKPKLFVMRCAIWCHLYNLKTGKIQMEEWPATLLKVTLLHGCFSRFWNCSNGTKLRKGTHLSISETVSIVASTTKSTVYAFRGLSFPAEKILMLFGNTSFQRLQDLPSPILYQWSFSILPENTLSDIQRDQWYEMG